jgi:hypothetical protein
LGFDITDQLLIRSFAFVKYWSRNVSTTRHYIGYSYTSRKPMIQLGGKYCILIEFEVPMKLLRLIKMCLNKIDSKVRIGKY